MSELIGTVIQVWSRWGAQNPKDQSGIPAPWQEVESLMGMHPLFSSFQVMGSKSFSDC